MAGFVTSFLHGALALGFISAVPLTAKTYGILTSAAWFTFMFGRRFSRKARRCKQAQVPPRNP